jgi:hypothetical protein
MKLDNSHLPVLLDDMDAAFSALKTALSADPAGWTRAPAGKWSAGQHAEHLALSLEGPLERLEQSLHELRQGSLGARPNRGIAQALVIRMLMRDPFPRGGKAAPFAQPGPTPSRESVFARLDAGRARLRRIVESLTPEERERLWLFNPFMEKRRWHYRLFEMVRIQATHTRHHTRQVIAATRGRPG